MLPTLSAEALQALDRDADRHALRIVRVCRIPQREREDLRQELLTELLRRLKHFDPDRGSLGGFASVCFSHHAARLIERILRGRTAMAVSLDAPLPGAGSLTIADALANEDGYGALMGQASDAVATLERRLDLGRALASLPLEQLRHCVAIAEERGDAPNGFTRSRSTVFRQHVRSD